MTHPADFKLPGRTEHGPVMHDDHGRAFHVVTEFDGKGYRVDEYVTYAPAPACRSCGFTDCPNAGNALDWCPRWDGKDGES